MPMLSFQATIPITSSAIRVGGGQGECARIQFDCYVGTSVDELLKLRGQQLMVIVGPVDQMAQLAEFIDHGESQRDSVPQ
jgi:hypothetical protein